MKLSCKDMNPATTCNFEVEGATADEVAQKMLDHAKVAHAADIAGQSDEDVLKSMEEKAHE